MSGLGEFVRRYWTISGEAWRQRKAQTPPKRLSYELEFLASHLELIDTPPHPAPLWTGRLLSGLILAAVGLCAVAQVDVVAKASGKVAPAGQTKTIASVDTATVRAISVVEGQTVHAGDTLLELDATPLIADRDKAQGEYKAAELQRARAAALLAAIDQRSTPVLGAVSGINSAQRLEADKHLQADYSDYEARLAAQDAEIAGLTIALAAAQEREGIYASLLDQKDVARDAWLEKEQARLDLQNRLSAANAARQTLIAQTRRDALGRLDEAERAAQAFQKDALHAGSHAAWLTLRAPVDGTVQQMTVHTVGGVVAAAEPLLRIVPSAPQVEVDAIINNRDVGFIQPGQRAAVKIETFDYTKFGAVPAHVVSVSRDAVEGKEGALLYTARVTLDRSTLLVDERRVALSPGMAVTVDITTGRRRILEYLFSPLVRHVQDSFHER